MSAIPDTTSTTGGGGANNAGKDPTTTALCHYCLAPSSRPLPFPCSRPFCGGSARYCSEACRDDDASAEGFHSEFRCRFIGRYCCRRVPRRGSPSGRGRSPLPLVQIVIADEEFPVYRRVGNDEVGGDGAGGDLSLSATFHPPFEPTGEQMRCRVGDIGRVVIGPGDIDAAGSVLVCLVRRGDDEKNDEVDGCDALRNTAGESLYILCDVPSLCGAPPDSVRRRNSTSDVRCRSNTAWMRGVEAWYNDKDYRGAMDWFKESLSEVCWIDDEDDAPTGATNDSAALSYFYERILLPPPLGLDQEQFSYELGRRAHFLGACFLDAQCAGEGLKWLVRSLRCLSLKSSNVGMAGGSWSVTGAGTNSVVMQNPAVSELALHSEETGCTELARAVASWSVDVGLGVWSNKMRRPGYAHVPSLPVPGEFGLDDSHNVLTEIRPHYPEEISHVLFPWIKVLEENYNVIKSEFVSLLQRKPSSSLIPDGESSTPDGTSLVQPAHWPAVGSAKHRTGGSDDHRVVSSGGDWRECVLFGAGCSATSGNSDAPRTKALIRHHCPDAVSLAEMGGGEVIFSVLAPGTRIAPHCASTNVRLTAHLGLIVPQCQTETEVNGGASATESLCTIRVADEWHTWRAGRVLVFDDTYEHEVVNSTDELRAVLLLRFWHPSIPIPERCAVLEAMMRLKGDDAIRRYNLPLPNEFNLAEARGMQWSSCQRCGRSGHESLRLKGAGIESWDSEHSGGGDFACVCGHGV